MEIYTKHPAGFAVSSVETESMASGKQSACVVGEAYSLVFSP